MHKFVRVLDKNGCSTIQLMLCCPPWQAFPQATSLCRLLLLGIVRWAILLYVPHLLWERHLCLVLMLPQVDLLLRMSGLPSSPSLLFGSSVPSILSLCAAPLLNRPFVVGLGYSPIIQS